jgi:hypothetical protein
MLVQPYVGMKSDNCRISWGKRRPFIVGGAVATIVSLMVLAWAKEIVTGTLGLFGLDSESWGVRVTVMVFAVLFVYVLDFAINVSKCLLRSVSCAVPRTLCVRLTVCSPSCYPYLHRRLCTHSPAGVGQCLDDPRLGRRQHHGLPGRKH